MNKAVSPTPAPPADAVQESPASSTARGPGLKPILIIIAILGVGVVLTALTADVAKVSEPGVRLVNGALFLEPQVGDWTGGEMTGLSEDELKILPRDTDGARRVYTNAAGRLVFCSVVLAGKDVTSIHRPELCLPGQGWTIERQFTETMPVAEAPGGQLTVMRMNTYRNIPVAEGRWVQARSLFFYWFVGKDRVTAHHWQRILWTAEDRILHNRNHRWAYILIHVPQGLHKAADSLSDEQALELAKDFIQAVYPTLTGEGSSGAAGPQAKTNG